MIPAFRSIRRCWRVVILVCFVLTVTGASGAAAESDTGTSPGRTQLHPIEQVAFPDVRSFAQDDQGFIWIGVNHQSEGGLIRHDGVSSTHYWHRPDDPTSLSHNQVYFTYVDNDGVLWVGTIRGGLNRYNPLTDNFTQYLHQPGDDTSLPSDDLKTMVQTSEGTHWVGTETGLARFDPGAGTFESYYHESDNPNSLPNSAVHALAEDPETGKLWIGTAGGLSIFDPTEATFDNYYNTEEPDSLSDDTVETIFRDSRGVWWVGTADGLNRYEAETDTFTRFLHDPDNPRSIGSSRIQTILEDSQGRFWVGHQNGLDLVERTTGTAVDYADEVTRADVLGGHLVQSLFEDRDGAIWIGSRFAGAARISPFPASVEYHRHLPESPRSIDSDFVARVAPADDGLWLVTDAGVEFFDGTRFIDKTDRLGLKKGWPDLHAILPVDDDEIWLGSNAGQLTRVNPQTGERRQYDVPEPAAKSAIWPVARAANGDVWFRVPWGYGVGVLHANGGIELLIGHDVDDEGPEQVYAYNTSHLFDPENQELWITGLGLTRIDVLTAEVEVYSFDSTNPGSVANQLWSVDKGPDGRLWLTSGNGVHEFDPTAGAYLHLHHDNLPIAGASDGRFGPDGRLWLLSGSTLVGMDTDTGAVVTPSVGNGKTTGSHLKMANLAASKLVVGPDDLMYAPTLERGLMSFSPRELSHNARPPTIVLTGLELFGQSARVGDHHGVLSTAINRTSDLRLANDQNTFTLDFAALNFEHPERNTYRYQLEGFESGWQETDAQRRFATYTNVPPGTYTFRVQAANNTGVWTSEGLAVAITIAAPWYETGWARLVELVMVLGALIVLYRWHTRRQRQRNQQLQRQLKERTRHNEERERLLAVVNEQSNRLQSILATAPIGVVLVDADLNVIVQNRLAANELRSLATFSRPGQIERFAGIPADQLLGDDTFETRLISTVGTTAEPRTLSVTVRPIDQYQDDSQGWVLLWDDVTELHELQKRRARQDRLAAVGQFAAGIAHDVNNLLTVIGLNAELLERDGGLEDRSRTRIRHITKETDTASRIMTQVLDYARHGISSPELLDINQVIGSQVRDLATVLKPGIRLKFKGKQPAIVRADPTQLERLIHNLVMNAQDAVGERGKISVVIDKSATGPVGEDCHVTVDQGIAPSNWVRIVVVDNGCGISEEVLPYIFEPFVTTKPIGRGTGLGLAQVAGIAADHGGVVSVESEVDKGTEFSVFLPCVDESISKPNSLPALRTPDPARTECILIVDDDNEILSVLKDTLATNGYRVVTAASGQAALDVWDEDQISIDLVLTDLTMPHMDGMSLVQGLQERGAQVPVIVMSGYAPNVTAHPRVVAVLRKPIDSASLFREVAAAL